MTPLDDPGPKLRAEAERLLQSGVLRHAGSLRRLLGYLVEETAAGHARDLKEYTIGREVMSKPEDYDPRSDASVRVQVGKLRQKLEEYYRTEGAGAEYQIQIPKGHFEIVLSAAEGATAPAAVDGRWRRRALWMAGAAAALAALSLFLMFRLASTDRAAGEWTPEHERFWGPFVSAKKPTLVVLGCPLFVRFQSRFFRDPYVNEWEAAPGKLPLEEMAKLLGTERAPLPTYRFTGSGEAAAAFQLAALLAPRHPGLSLKRSTSFAWEDLKSHNTIFIGPPKFNLQLKNMPIEEEFTVDRGIWNREPKPGEPPLYRKRTQPGNEDVILEEYALITRVEGYEGWGSLLVLSSTSTEGTWAAAEYVGRDASLRDLRERLAAGGGAPPSSYQLVVRARFQEQVPIEVRYVTHRALKLPRGADAAGR